MVEYLSAAYGYGSNCYRIQRLEELDTVLIWLHQNDVDHWMISSGSNGYVIQLRSDPTLFNLRWI